MDIHGLLFSRGHEVINLTIISQQHGSSVSKALIKDRFAILKVGPSDNIAAEAWGLQSLGAVPDVHAPEVIDHWEHDHNGYLLMEYVPGRSAKNEDMVALGQMVATLHGSTSESFGASVNNFIGSLDQDNRPMEDWGDFWWERRILPQLHLAKAQGYDLMRDRPDLEKKIRISHIVAQVKKGALLHGDLWNGNYMIHEDGRPFLIDPCPYYGDPRVDLAMTRLFGGFGPSFYSAYKKTTTHGLIFNEEVNQFYQLYFLLNHLNMFGSGYLGSVRSCLDSIR